MTFTTGTSYGPVASGQSETSSVSEAIVLLGPCSQGSKTAVGLRFTQAAFQPAAAAPITSKGLLETSQVASGAEPVTLLKCA